MFTNVCLRYSLLMLTQYIHVLNTMRFLFLIARSRPKCQHRDNRSCPSSEVIRRPAAVFPTTRTELARCWWYSLSLLRTQERRLTLDFTV